MSQEKVRLSAFVVVASILALGCSRGDGLHPKFAEEQEVRGIVRDFQLAIRTKNDRWGCSLLTDSLERSLASSGRGCGVSGFKGIARARTLRTNVSGEEATADLGEQGARRIKLQFVGGEPGDNWEISKLPAG